MIIEPSKLRQMEAIGTAEYCPWNAQNLFKLKQTSEEWHSARRLRVTASKIASIAGLVPHRDGAAALQEMFNPPQVNANMRRGLDLQLPIAEDYIKLLQVSCFCSVFKAVPLILPGLHLLNHRRKRGMSTSFMKWAS